MYIKCSEEYDATNAFSSNADLRVRAAAQTTSSELLEIYAYDPSFLVRYTTAKNPNTPGDVLADMLHSQLDDEQRRLLAICIAGHGNALPESLEELSTISSWTVRHKVAQNPNTSNAVLEALLDDEDRDVRSAAATALYERGVR